MIDDRTFYGPHPCAICAKMIVKASPRHGGEAFDAPVGPIYPNTDWRRHDCGPATVDGREIEIAILVAITKISGGEIPAIAPPFGEKPQ